MSGIGDNEFDITSWGWRDGKRVWCVVWNERPGMVAYVVGPDKASEAFDEIHARREQLTWEPSNVAS